MLLVPSMLRFPFCSVRIKAVIYLFRRKGTKEIDLPMARQSDGDGLCFPVSWFQRKANVSALAVG
jgi:hypothetical protein